jgi:hypothetical protein
VKGVGSFDHVTFTGTFDPGLSPALTTVGSITFTPTNTLIMELGGTNRGTQYDAIVASGTLGLDGTLAVTLIDGFNPAAGNSFDLFDWANLAGTFDTLQLPALSAGLMWNTSQLYTTGALNVALAGDYNFDSTVNAADYVVWRKGIGTESTPANYNLWRTNFGRAASGAGLSATGSADAFAVPEPSIVALVFLELAAFCAMTRRI